MRKLTHYKVSGVLETKPTDLPEGLNVEEVSVELPPDELYLQTAHGESHRFAESLTTEAALAITSLGLFYKPEVVKLRDFCNKVLGEDPKPKMRVLEDSSGDWWFELVPGLFTFGSKYAEGKTALEDAQTKRQLNDGRYIDWTEQRLRDCYSYVGDVTNTWED